MTRRSFLRAAAIPFALAATRLAPAAETGPSPGTISAAALREALGFAEQDAPTRAERRLAGNGILWVDDRLSDPFLEDLTASMTDQIEPLDPDV